MFYVKIHGEETPYAVDIMPFTTQHGYDAVRFIGEEIPITDKGFDFYDDNDQLIADLTKYKYFYSDNAYSVEYDEIESPKGSDAPLPPSPYSKLSSRISQVNSRVTEITPYEETKKAYAREIEKVFYNVPNGNLTVFFDNYSGEYEVKRIADRITISFPERLTDATNVTIMIQK